MDGVDAVLLGDVDDRVDVEVGADGLAGTPDLAMLAVANRQLRALVG